MEVSAEVILTGLVLVVGGTGSHVRLATMLKTMKTDLDEVKTKVTNGAFVRKEDCLRQHTED